jgi:hypothetical protein
MSSGEALDLGQILQKSAYLRREIVLVLCLLFPFFKFNLTCSLIVKAVFDG